MEPLYLKIEEGCVTCLLARHPSLIGHKKKQTSGQFPYCVKLVHLTKDYSKARITSGIADRHVSCPLLTKEEVAKDE